MEFMKSLEEKSSSTNRLRFPSEDGNSPARLFEDRLRNLRRDASIELMVGQVETDKETKVPQSPKASFGN
ncbi:hypothetical protein NC651_004783 [Populus alba x Populus x berolinensis]|nr:hypothetical protein NC651_004783 [Populus alba x Populus x berolinensis]